MVARLLAIALLGTGQFGACSGYPESVQPTRVHYYTAFKDGKLAPGLKVTGRVPGDCWATSGVEGRPYTWRCGEGNYVHDPCFSATPRARLVACPDAPWNKRVLVLALSEPLPEWVESRGGRWRRWPWGVVTSTGKHCFTTSASATGQVAGMQHTYVCKEGGLLLGFPRRNSPAWTIYYARNWSSQRPKLVRISDAWW